MNSQRLEAVEGVDVLFGVFHHDGFGELQLQPAGSQIRFLQHLGDHIADAWLLELQTGEIHRYPDRLVSLLLPGLVLAARRFQNPCADALNQTGVLENRHELGRRDHAVAGISPAQQGFDADQAAAGKIDLGLVMQGEFVPLKRPAQAGFQFQSLHGLVGHFAGIEAVVVLSLIPGLVHGGFGVGQQRFDIVAGHRRKRDAHAAGAVEAASFGFHRPGQRTQNTLGDPGRLVLIGEPAQRHGELDPADPGHGFSGRRALRHSLANGLQNPVAGGVAQGLVDVFEVLLIEKQHADHGAVPVRPGQLFLEPSGQQGPVGQAGERIKIGQLLDFAFGRLALGDVHQGADQPSRLAARSERRLVKEYVVAGFVGVNHRAFVHLDPPPAEQRLIGPVIQIGQILRGDIVRRSSHNPLQGQADEFFEGFIAAQVDALFILVVNRRGDGVDDGLQLPGFFLQDLIGRA